MTSSKLPAGFSGNGISAGLKKSGKPDLGIIFSESNCTAAGVFTTNVIQGANIPLNIKNLKNAVAHGIIVHSGQANVCTGEEGNRVARETLNAVSKATNTKPEEWVLGSTGVIGVLPNLEKLQAGITKTVEEGLTEEGLRKVSRAMLTTDLVEKVFSTTVELNGKQCTITGFAKGSGMIHPNMATMLAYIMTDAAISKEALSKAMKTATDYSFNSMTVDGDTSTSDMSVVLANGAAGNDEVQLDSTEYQIFCDALTEVCQDLTKKIARDGEGATRLVTIKSIRAKTWEQGRDIAKSVAESNLVKTALFGRDPNWGRIACAIGYSGKIDDVSKMEIKLMDVTIFKNMEPVSFDKPALSQKMKDTEDIDITIDLGLGDAKATVWTCDLTYDYVRINAEYTT